MNTETFNQHLPQYSWRNAVVTLAVLLFTLGAVYWETFYSMISIWARSETFAHGFLIFPISILLIWRKRRVLSKIIPQPQAKALAGLFCIVILWLMGEFAGALVVKQFAVVAMVPALTWLVLGNQVLRVLVFPLSYLFFSIPTLEFLVPVLQDFTAEFTVKALKVLEIPVFWEGRFFYIPTGSFEVAEACSGIRYLIACIALGVLYAYLNYTSLSRRLIFVGLAIVVPIIANGMRALGIVLLAYNTNQEFGRGIDHIIYGWLFFGVVIFLLFWFGSFFREDKNETSINNSNSIAQDNTISQYKISDNPTSKPVWIAGIAIVFLFLPPLSASLKSATINKSVSEIEMPKGAWSGPYERGYEWKPKFNGVTTEKMAEYKHQNDTVIVYIGRYSYQSQNAELINSDNKLFDEHVWRRVDSGTEKIKLPSNRLWNVNSITIRSKDKTLLLWYWYEIAEKPTISKLVAKFRESKMRLLGEISDSYIVVLATPIFYEEHGAEAVLGKYVIDMLSNIRSSLHERNSTQFVKDHG
jgi:exosortase A